MDLHAAATAHVPLPTRHTRRRSKSPLPDAVDIAIIGAGLGGLCAGAHLARAGFSVAVFDAHYVAGGCSTMFSRGTGHARWTFDIGLHYVGDCGPDGHVARALAPLGVEVDWRPLDPDGFDEIVLPDMRFRIPANRALYRDRLVALFPEETRGIDHYVRLLDEVDAITSNIGVLDNPFRLIPHILRRGRLLARSQHATIGAFLDRCVRDPRLKTILLGQSGDYGVAPSKASAVLHCGLANHYFKGAHYPRGGGQVIADALCEIIEAHGGHVLLRKPITRIAMRGGRAAGVMVDLGRHGHAEVRASHVISNADVKHTFQELLPVEHVPKRLKKQCARWEMSSSLMMTCLGVRADMTELGMRNANYWCFDRPDVEGMYQAIHRGDMTPRMAYITSGSLKDPSTLGHAPRGHTSVEIMTLMPHVAHWGCDDDPKSSLKYRRQEAYQQQKEQAQQVLIDTLDQVFPGAKDAIVFSESATPATHRRFTWATEGSAYGLAFTPSQVLDKRPGYRGPVPSLYLCGASTKAGHGIAGALTSGLEVAKALAEDTGRQLDTP